ncbi:MAG: methyltransferase domain-containing protein [Rickettsiales bacterium]
MLQPDVLTIRQFYSSPVGLETRRTLINAIRRFWPGAAGDSMIGIGYVLPVLRTYLGDASLIGSFMPRSLGAIYWPADTANHSILIDELQLPLKDQSVNRVIVSHTLEHTPHINSFLKEIWRVLVPGGRALILVPNRRGIWVRASDTPFGSGTPFTIAQLRHRAALANFTFVRADTTLFFPPSSLRIMIRISRALEWMGRIFLPGYGGVILLEVEKQIYAAIPEPVEKESMVRYATAPIASMKV